MYNNKKYIIVTFLCILSLAFLVSVNYKVVKVIDEKQNKIMQIGEKSKNKYISTKKFGYSDIINTLGNQEEMRIIRFIQQKEENTASVEIEVSGDIYVVEKLLKNIENKENFQNIQNIRMEKCEDNSMITRLNMNFIKNK